MDYITEIIEKAREEAQKLGFASVDEAYSELIGKETLGAEHDATKQPSQ